MFFLNNYKKKSDEALMVLVSKQDQGALTEIYKRYSKRILNYFYKMLWSDEQMAQDYLHDLFCKIIDKPNLFDANRKFSTWIYTVANNMCKNAYRKAGMDLIEYSESLIDQNYIDKQDETKLQLENFQDYFKLAIEDIGEDHRAAFIMRFQEHLPITEIAEIQNCSEGTVKSRLFYAKKKLAEKLNVFNPNY